ncbi:MAG TPA: hypothetical protein VFL93_15890 [Longimicrobiaceae bacterium]|jgi:hypothetical protein|nr:hypothetical protein [Longimicrobiaceae bacterium]
MERGIACRRGRFVTAALVLLLAACHSATDASGSSGPGWMRASFAEAPDTTVGNEFEGDGAFGVNPDPGAGLDASFQLSSTDIGSGRREDISFYRPGKGQPAPGRYALAPLTTEDGHPSGFTAYYSLQADQSMQGYTALSGSVTIEKSTSEAVDGTFEITMVQTDRYTSIGDPDNWSAPTPNTITPGAKQIVVRGSFHAIPDSEREMGWNLIGRLPL